MSNFFSSPAGEQADALSKFAMQMLNTTFGF
jgi:hypothetical protein